MKCLLLVCLLLVLAEFSAHACYCPNCVGSICMGTDSNGVFGSCICVNTQPGKRHAEVWAKQFGNRKGLKARTNHMKAPLRFRKKVKVARLHRKKASKNV